MTDGVFPDRLTQLRTRWEADPASRIFLQLAEEYRHLGRVQEALTVLDKGLDEHPGYLSALVAKGRCHLELGDGESARSVLERVVKQDATQMVANKLLVRAYLETGDPVKARERLDLYSLLNDSDPEIEDLRRRVQQLERPVTPPPTPIADLFELPPPARLRSPDVFELEPPAAANLGGNEVFDLAPSSPDPTPPASRLAPGPAEEEDLLFPEVSSQESRRRYLDALGAEGLFSFENGSADAAAPLAHDSPPPPLGERLSDPPVSGEVSWLEELATASPVEPARPYASLLPVVPVPEPPVPMFVSKSETAEELWEEEPGRMPGPLPEPAIGLEEATLGGTGTVVATATLGELYFRQGHYAEAERIFREVLEREPGNDAARIGLNRLADLGPQPEMPRVDARRLLAGYRADTRQPADAELRSRKIFVLGRYLERLRQGSPRDVS